MASSIFLRPGGLPHPLLLYTASLTGETWVPRVASAPGSTKARGAGGTGSVITRWSIRHLQRAPWHTPPHFAFPAGQAAGGPLKYPSRQFCSGRTSQLLPGMAKDALCLLAQGLAWLLPPEGKEVWRAAWLGKAHQPPPRHGSAQSGELLENSTALPPALAPLGRVISEAATEKAEVCAPRGKEGAFLQVCAPRARDGAFLPPHIHADGGEKRHTPKVPAMLPSPFPFHFPSPLIGFALFNFVFLSEGKSELCPQ